MLEIIFYIMRHNVCRDGLVTDRSFSVLTGSICFQLILPSAFDEAGIRMLDSIREIFDILYFDFESVGFNLVKYKNFDDLVHAINNGKCPVVDVLKEHYSSEKDGSHVMVATGIKHKDGVRCIQLKNSFADNPNEQGTVQSTKFII